MIALTFVTLFVVGVASASASLAGVDPNTLQCDPAGQVFLLLPHFTDCSKFYMCTHGQEVEFSCSGGLIFDFVLQTCNWDWATECTLRTSEEDAGGDEEDEELEGSGESSGDFEWSAFHDTEPIDKLIAAAPLVSESVVGPSATVQHSNFAAILDCHSPVGAARQVPYKGDCQRFWRCIDGLPHSAYCSDGLFFNESTQQCDFEANVKCAHNSEDELQGEFILHQ